jgi:D-alanyl-D-alanine carboxypeptidase
MKVYTPLILCSSLLFSLNVFAENQAPHPNEACDSTCIKKVQNVLDSYRTKYHVPGLQVTLSFSNLPMQVFCSGSRTVDGKNPITPSSLFEIGSTTKSFSAAVILKLVSEGKINLDDTVGKWFGDEYPAWKDNTVRDLLNMTSTTFDYFDNDGGLFEKVYWQNPTHLWTTKELSDWSYKNGPNCTRNNPEIPNQFCALKPGEGWSYSNTNYILLDRIAEKASGESFTKLIRQRILKPLNLKSAIYDPKKNPATIKNFTNAYHYDPKTDKFEDVSNFNLSAAQAAGAIITTTEDLAKWARALFSGKVLPAKEFKAMTTVACITNSQDCQAGRPVPESSKEPGYSCGLMRFPIPKTNQILWLHTGGSAGHGTIFIYDPQNDFVLTAAQNQIGAGDLSVLARGIAKAISSPTEPAVEKVVKTATNEVRRK